ncbi:hypothetical protein V1T75_09175 [Tenacibaculum sp. FZY0031]|uniref:hypothetical protein n=1 Tax=Tenacibaculum sp. FZY0031 TaxID=3116648 RepID=UPI002E9B8C28|nr:hypothetical protein [Tenacibaculum sp. FZY0031]
MKFIKIITFTFLVITVKVVNAQKSASIMRTIYVAGLVFDYNNLKPISGIDIYNKSNEFLVKTDERGYFKTQLHVKKTGEIYFSLIIKGEKFKTIIQSEHWGDIQGNLKAIYYFGLTDKNNKDKPFSELSHKIRDTSYEIIIEGFKEVKEKINLNNKIQENLKGNENVFIVVDGNYYIVNETGRIKLKSKEDLISINNNEYIPAHKVNSILKRNEIKNMSNSNSKNASVIIYTKK